MVRLHGSLQPVEDSPELSPPVIQTLLYAILTQRQRERFEAELELDFAYAVPGQSRFRVNMYRQRDAVGAARAPIQPVAEAQETGKRGGVRSSGFSRYGCLLSA